MLKNGKELYFMKKIRFSLTRMTAMLLVLVCMLGLLPATALAASPSTIKMDDCTHNGVKYESPALGVDDVWDSGYTWTMNAWVQAIIWRYKAGLLSDPVTACAEELMCVYNNLEHTSYTSIDNVMGDKSFRDRAQYILDLGAQGVWGECSVYEYAYTGSGSKYHPANDVQAIMIGELNTNHVVISNIQSVLFRGRAVLLSQLKRCPQLTVKIPRSKIKQPAKDLSSIKIREAMNGAERKEGIENQAHPSGPDKLYGKWAVKRRAKQACRSCCPA